MVSQSIARSHSCRYYFRNTLKIKIWDRVLEIYYGHILNATQHLA